MVPGSRKNFGKQTRAQPAKKALRFGMFPAIKERRGTILDAPFDCCFWACPLCELRPGGRPAQIRIEILLQRCVRQSYVGPRYSPLLAGADCASSGQNR